MVRETKLSSSPANTMADTPRRIMVRFNRRRNALAGSRDMST